MQGIFVLLLCFSAVWQVQCATRTSLDIGWKFLNLASAPSDVCDASSYTRIDPTLQCYGLQAVYSATTAEQCQQACCNLGSQCQAWQFCNSGNCASNPPCWAGTYTFCDKWGRSGWTGASKVNASPNLAPTLNAAPGSLCTSTACFNTTNDSSWRTVNVPHDYIIEGTYNPSSDMSHGFLPKSKAWYRRQISIPTSAVGKSIWIDFDGVFRDCLVFFNNYYLGNHVSGYTSFRFFLPENRINYGGNNLLSVYVDATGVEGWWYEGGGIYRHVWMNVADKLHVAPWGVYAPSVVTGKITDSGAGQISNKAVVNTQTTVVNDYNSLQDFVLTTAVMQGTRVLRQVSTQATLRPASNVTLPQSLTLEGDINLWSPASPSLYTVVTNVYSASNLNTPLDTVSTRIGIRTVVFDPNMGMFLNGRPFKINGACNHQDFAGVGTAVPERINVFRVQKLKQMGMNGWRMSHNPPNPELLDMLDELGMVVMDENRNFADKPQYYQDFADMVLRDRNHPSIIMWSVCNEYGCMPGDENGAIVGANFKSILLSLDTTRPFTAAMNSDWGTGLSKVLDLQGVNYNYGQIPTFHASYKTVPVHGSEAGSCMGSRGVVVTNDAKAQKNIQNTDYCARDWTSNVLGPAYSFGGFAWTGFDYKGEPFPYQWPAISSHYGIIDSAGFEKDTWFYYLGMANQSTVVHLVPANWNPSQWAAGQRVEIFCYSNTPKVELFLNGVSQGAPQSLGAYQRGLWYVNYAQGKLECRGYDATGRLLGSDVVQTTGVPAKLVISADTPTTISATGQDVALIRVTVQDSQGRMVPDASNFITFSVSGPGSVIGTGNGDPSDHTSDKATARNAFNGLVRAIVQSTTTKGQITVTASASGLPSVSLTLYSQ